MHLTCVKWVTLQVNQLDLNNFSTECHSASCDMLPSVTKARLKNVTQVLTNLLDDYDIRLRPDFGGKLLYIHWIIAVWVVTRMTSSVRWQNSCKLAVVCTSNPRGFLTQLGYLLVRGDILNFHDLVHHIYLLVKPALNNQIKMKPPFSDISCFCQGKWIFRFVVQHYVIVFHS